MSNYIKVDHSKFEAAATAIESYISKHKKNMSSAGTEVNNLSTTWAGKDFTVFQNKWNEVTKDDSTSKQMLNSLEVYEKFLRYAASQYKEAQSKAINKTLLL